MNIQQLIYVTEIEQCGSISKAAHNLYVAQPNVSSSIKKLEEELGIAIFERTSKGIKTTRDGKEFISYANDVIGRMNVLEKRYQSAHVSHVSVTSMRSSKVCYKIIEYVKSLKEAPFRLTFREATNLDAINDVVDHKADLGIIHSNMTNFEFFLDLAQKRHCEYEMLPSERYSVLVSARDPLVEKQTVTREMLNGYTEIIHEDFETSIYPYSPARADDSSGSCDRRVVFVSDRATLLDFIGAGNHTYTWTTSTDRSILKKYDLAELPCREQDMEGREALIYAQGRIFNNDILRLLNILSTPLIL